MTRTLLADPDANAVWAAVCRHSDGLAVGTTVAALHRHDVLARLDGRASSIAGQVAARSGFLMVALRLLADQGWVELSGNPDDPFVRTTPSGQQAFALARYYQRAVDFLAHTGSALSDQLDGRTDPAPLAWWRDRVAAGWDLPADGADPSVTEVVRQHLDGHVVAPVMAAIVRRQFAAPVAAQTPALTPPPELARPFRDAADEAVAAILATQGWLDRESGQLTRAGIIAQHCAPQYWYPVTYIPMLRTVADLLFGRPPTLDTDDHLDRALDLRFSAEVFRRNCRSSVVAAVRGVFADRPLERQPRAVIDVGCGDGTVLRAIWEEIRDRTPRGSALGDFPLRLVGVEPSEIGRALTQQTLTQETLSYDSVTAEVADEGARAADVVTLAGDIARPDLLAEQLRACGVDPADALWVTKSVIHDREYRPVDADDALVPPPGNYFALPDADGAAIATADLATSLVTLLRRWRPFMERHGFLVVEAHQAAVATTIANLGCGVNTALDATHGYSCQYPLPPEVFAWATEQAGWRSEFHAEPGADRLGYITLTVDRFVNAEPGDPTDGN